MNLDFKLVETVPFAPRAGVPSRLTVQKYVLPSNGLTVLLLRDPVAPVIAYHTWYRVGSRNEQPGTTGIAHLFEHLMFNQTEHLAAGEFDKLMEAAGGDTNAGTWVDWTYYRDSLPAKQLELAVRLEADRMAHLTLTAKQVESEIEVVANERRFRVDDDVLGSLEERAFALAYEKHPYHWPTIGWMEDIKAMTPAKCEAFYKTYYAPNNATVVLVGDFEPERALALIREHYGNIPRSRIPAETPVVEPAQTAERRAAIQKPLVSDRVVVAYKSPAQADADFVPMQFLDDVLLGGPSSRLYRRLVIDDEIASDTSSFIMPFRDPGLYIISITMKRGHNAPEAEQRIYAEVARLAAGDVTPAELEKARARLETGFWGGLTSSEGKAEALGHYETTMGDFRTLFAVADLVRGVTATDVRDVARRWLTENRRTVVTAQPLTAAKPRARRSKLARTREAE